MNDLLVWFNTWLIGPSLPVAILVAGGFFLFRLKGFYVLHPVRVFKGMLSSSKSTGESSFRSVTLALAGTLGVGNIVGVASAILCGGPGAVFWMWMGALISMSLKYAEILLSVFFRKDCAENGKDGYHGGAMYYIRDGLRSVGFHARPARFAGGVFAVFCILNSLTTGTIIQVNAISGALSATIGMDPRVSGAAVMVCTAAALLAGSRNISTITVVLIPIASLIYLVMSLSILAVNLQLLPELLVQILRGAFGLRSAAGGLIGYSMMQAIRYGIGRGIISNEAGCGTAPTAHARANAKTPAQQGFWGIFEVFVDTILLCSMTAFVILIFLNKTPNFSDANSVTLTLAAYRDGFGQAAGWLLGGCVFVFAYATVICQYYYGTESLRYLSQRKPATACFFILFFGAILYGSLVKSETAWQITDLAVGVMTILNTLVLLALRGTVVSETDRYFQRSKSSSRQRASKARGSAAEEKRKSALMSERKTASGMQEQAEQTARMRTICSRIPNPVIRSEKAGPERQLKTIPCRSFGAASGPQTINSLRRGR